MADAEVRSRCTDAPAVLRRLSSLGYGYVSLFDLAALMILAIHGLPEPPGGAFEKDPAQSTPGTSTLRETPGPPGQDLKSGPFTVTTQPSGSQLHHLEELRAAVYEAARVHPGDRHARSAVRRSLMARGSGVRDAIAVVGLVCELIERPPDNHALRRIGGSK